MFDLHALNTIIRELHMAEMAAGQVTIKHLILILIFFFLNRALIHTCFFLFFKFCLFTDWLSWTLNFCFCIE